MTDENTISRNLESGWRQWPDKLFLCAVALFFFLLPWQTRYFIRETPLYEWGTLSIYGMEVLGWIVILLYAWQYRETESPARRRLGLLFLGLPILAFLSIVWAPDKPVALQAALRLTEGIILFFIIKNFVGNWKLKIVNFLVWAFIAGAVIQAGLGIYQFLTQSAFTFTLLGIALHDPAALGTAVVEFGDQRWLRAYGGLPHPNVLGGYLVITLAVLLHAMNKEHGTRNNLIFDLCSLLLVTGMFFSFSRAAWLAAGSLLLVGLVRPGGRIRTINLILIGWLAALIVLYWPLASTRLSFLTTGQNSVRPDIILSTADRNADRLEMKSYAERLNGMREGWEIIKNNPVLGVGIGNYTQARQNLDIEKENLGGQIAAREARPARPLWSYQPVHNVLLLIWAELGLVGLALFLTILYLMLKQSKFYILHFTFYILLLFDHYLWTLPLGTLLFLGIFGLSTNHPQVGLDKKAPL